MKACAVIPARMGSSRFPGKPLISILGLPMIEHVRRRVERMKKSLPMLTRVVVATCDEEIRVVVEKAGGEVVMTSPLHERATDRVEEVASKLDADIFLNVQGDEPMVSVGQIKALLDPFALDAKTQTTCLVYPIQDASDLSSLNVVKCVLSLSGKIIYLSRAGIPGKEIDLKKTKYYKQSGLMAFQKDFLHKFSKLSPTPLEAKESVDLLRILEHDYSVQGVIYPDETLGVDVPDQVKSVEDAIIGDPVQKAEFLAISKEGM